MRYLPFLLLASLALVLMAGEADADAIPVGSFGDYQIVTTSETGKFVPEAQEPGEAKILLVDDDMENWYSGPYVETTHIVTALNDGGYSYDIFRTGKWNVSKELPSGDAGLSMVDNYEVIIWYSGWNTQIFSNSEEDVLMDYLDGECGTSDSFCTSNRNILQLTQGADWLDMSNGDFFHDYLHTNSSANRLIGETVNPMEGVSGSIFDGKSYSTGSAGVYYLSAPVPVESYDSYSMGAFQRVADQNESFPYHAIQYPGINSLGQETWDPSKIYQYRSLMFSEEIGAFDSRTDRADFFAITLEWMEITPLNTQDTDLGLSVLDIPRQGYLGVIVKNVPFEVRIGVTNYGNLDADFVRVRLQLKNEFGIVLFDRIFDSRAFPEGHPMYLEKLEPGETLNMTFNLANDRYQLNYNGEYEDFARPLMFTTSGMHYLSANLVDTDQNQNNAVFKVRVGAAHAIETAEPGDYSTAIFGDTDDNGANSYDGINWHITDSYDWDADGCGWARTCDGLQNQTGRSVVNSGQYAFASFNPDGWYKTGASPSDCDWDEFGDSDCPKFVPNPYQDDYVQFGPYDFSSMEEVVVMFMFTGCMESGDYFRYQISKNGDTWTNLINYGGFCPDEGMWYQFGGSNAKYQGNVLDEAWYGSSDTTSVYIRFQMDADTDQVTESSSRPYSGWFVDDIAIRGTERPDKDIGVSDMSLRYDDFISGGKWSDRQIEVNFTAYNTGNYSYNSLQFCYTIFDDQGNEILDESCDYNDYPAYSQYGDVTEAGHEDETKHFLIFEAPKVGIYTIIANLDYHSVYDYFPWNHTVIIEVEILDHFFSDDFDEDELAYTQFHSASNEDNGFYWVQGDSTTGDAHSGSTMFRYYEQGTNSYASGADDSAVTPDVCDRDGGSSFFADDICIDLIAGYEATLEYAIKWDLANGDRLEVRISSDFNSSQKLGSWTVLKTYEGTNGDWASSAWFLEEIDLSNFTREQVWIDFRMVSNNGGGKGVLLDSMDVKGKEYRNNLAIIDVTTDRFTMAGEEHDLSITIKSFSREPQTAVTVQAVMKDSNGVRVWPTDQSFNYFTLPVALETGETFTVDPTTAGSDWRWGAERMTVSDIYTLHVEVWRDDESQVPDEYRDDNVRNIMLVLGANMLGSDEWSGDWSESDGVWSWDGSSSGTLTSDSFIVWNNRPWFAVEAEYDLIDANVKAQVRAGTSGEWYDIEWRAVDQQSTLYSIPGADYSQPPDQWTGKSSFDKTSVQTFYADLGAVEQLSDGSGNLQEQYIHNSMQIRLVGVSDGGSGFFISHEILVIGMDDHQMDVISVTPNTWEWLNNNIDVIDYDATINYTVTVRNLGAITDSPVIDFVIDAPENSFVTLNDGTVAIMDSILQQGRDTVVAIKPISGTWGDGRNNWDGGDQTAYIYEGGLITWPSGMTEYNTATGWRIYNPTKSNWDSIAGRPQVPSPGFFIGPGETRTINLEITCRYSGWTPAGTYILQADSRSWTDYDHTFTISDPDGQATIVIDRTDYYLGSIYHDSEGYSTIHSDPNTSLPYYEQLIWNGDMNPYFIFDVEYFSNMPSLATSNPEYGSVAILDSEGNILIQTWELIEKDGGTLTRITASAADLGLYSGLVPAADDSVLVHSFYIKVDPNDETAESNENNNHEEIQISITYDTAPRAYINSNLTLNRTIKGHSSDLVGSGVDIGGDITEYVWNSSIDGALGNEANISTRNLSLGVHDISLTVKDSIGLWSKTVNTIVWVYTNPVAYANDIDWNDEDPKNRVKPGDEVIFKGGGNDEDGEIVLYEWDFNGDGEFDWSSGKAGATTFIYKNEGIYTAVLQVTDNDGFTATDSRVITVSEKDEDEGSNPISILIENIIPIIIVLAILIGGPVYMKSGVDYTPPPQTTKPVTPSTRSEPMFSPSSMIAIECPSCGAQMEVPSLGMMQNVTCDECGLSGEIEI